MRNKPNYSQTSKSYINSTKPIISVYTSTSRILLNVPLKIQKKNGNVKKYWMATALCLEDRLKHRYSHVFKIAKEQNLKKRLKIASKSKTQLFWKNFCEKKMLFEHAILDNGKCFNLSR